jgi:transcriptional regulator with XRE-family HTH domain
LAELRKQLGFTQTAVAKSTGVSQSALPQLELQDALTNLRPLIRALGGELDRVAFFGDRSIVLTHAGST